MRNYATTTVGIGFPVGLILWEHAQMRQMVYPQSFFVNIEYIIFQYLFIWIIPDLEAYILNIV